MALHNSLPGGDSREGRALLPGNRNRRRGNGLRLGQGLDCVKLDIGKISPLKVWSGTGTAAQGSGGVPILGGITRHTDVSLGDMVYTVVLG